ncbi:MAG: DUF3298 domain-containing protein [Bacteroidota bacterium]
MTSPFKPDSLTPVDRKRISCFWPIAALFLLLVTTFSCSTNEDSELQTIPESRTPDLIAETFTPRFASPDCTLEEEACVELFFHYPVYNDLGEWTDSLTRWTETQLVEHPTRQLHREIEGLAHEWFDDWEQFHEEIDGYRIPWRLERAVEVVYENEELVTLHFSEFSFAGGAHPNQYDFFQSFTKPEGRRILLRDLTPDSTSWERLLDLAEEHFRYTFELLEEQDLDEAGFFFDDGRFHLTENIAFTQYGLLIHFNSYEVAPYTIGPISIELSYDELEHLIKSRWMPPTSERPS